MTAARQWRFHLARPAAERPRRYRRRRGAPLVCPPVGNRVVGTTTLRIRPADMIFADGFWEGSFSAWSSTFGAGTRITVR